MMAEPARRLCLSQERGFQDKGFVHKPAATMGGSAKPRRGPQRAGMANPEGERRAPSEEIFTANRPQQSVKAAGPEQQPLLAIDRRGPKAAQIFCSLASARTNSEQWFVPPLIFLGMWTDGRESQAI